MHLPKSKVAISPLLHQGSHVQGSVSQAVQKLSGEWSAPEYAKVLTREVLTELLPNFEMMEPLVRARLLMAAASLPASAQDAMREQLQVCSACIATLPMQRVWHARRHHALGTHVACIQHAVLCSENELRTQCCCP